MFDTLRDLLLVALVKERGDRREDQGDQCRGEQHGQGLIAAAAPSIRPRVALTRRLIGLESAMCLSQPGIVAGETKTLLTKVTGKRFTKPRFITAVGVRSGSPSVVHAHDSTEANQITSATPASTPRAPPLRELTIDTSRDYQPRGPK